MAADEKFAQPFAKLSKAFRVKKHAVWDKEGKRFDLEASVETKGLLGTDGRKYVLDLYRITPLDIAWQEEEEGSEEGRYPHRMAVLRTELVELFFRYKMREWANAEIAKRGQAAEDKAAGNKAAEGDAKADGGASDEAATPAQAESGDEATSLEASRADDAATEDPIDASKFEFALNPDVFSGQIPQTDEEKEQMAADETGCAGCMCLSARHFDPPAA